MSGVRLFLSVYLALILLEIRWDGKSFHDRLVGTFPTRQLIQITNQGFAFLAHQASRWSRVWFDKTHSTEYVQKARR